MEGATTAAKNAPAIRYGSGSNTSSPDIVGMPLRRMLDTAEPPNAPETKPISDGTAHRGQNPVDHVARAGTGYVRVVA